jgi:hypothetical protein
MGRISIKPGKQISGISVFMLAFLFVFGIAFGLLINNVLVENDAPTLMSLAFYILIICWNGTVLIMLIYHSKNYFGKWNYSLIDMEKEDDKADSPVERLRELETGKKEGLITPEEFERKRKEILEEKW